MISVDDESMCTVLVSQNINTNDHTTIKTINREHPANHSTIDGTTRTWRSAANCSKATRNLHPVNKISIAVALFQQHERPPISGNAKGCSCKPIQTCDALSARHRPWIAGNLRDVLEYHLAQDPSIRSAKA
jgi:hypothetical protein